MCNEFGLCHKINCQEMALNEYIPIGSNITPTRKERLPDPGVILPVG